MDFLNEICELVLMLKSPKDIEVCHGAGVSKNRSKKTIVRLRNRKYAKKAFISRKKT